MYTWWLFESKCLLAGISLHTELSFIYTFPIINIFSNSKLVLKFFMLIISRLKVNIIFYLYFVFSIIPLHCPGWSIICSIMDINYFYYDCFPYKSHSHVLFTSYARSFSFYFEYARDSFWIQIISHLNVLVFGNESLEYSLILKYKLLEDYHRNIKHAGPSPANACSFIISFTCQ